MIGSALFLMSTAVLVSTLAYPISTQELQSLMYAPQTTAMTPEEQRNETEVEAGRLLTADVIRAEFGPSNLTPEPVSETPPTLTFTPWFSIYGSTMVNFTTLAPTPSQAATTVNATIAPWLVVCRRPPFIANGSALNGGNRPGTKRLISCDPGFVRRGDDFYAVCGFNGKWYHSAECVQVRAISPTTTPDPSKERTWIALIVIVTIVAIVAAIFMIMSIYLLCKRYGQYSL